MNLSTLQTPQVRLARTGRLQTPARSRTSRRLEQWQPARQWESAPRRIPGTSPLLLHALSCGGRDGLRRRRPWPRELDCRLAMGPREQQEQEVARVRLPLARLQEPQEQQE